MKKVFFCITISAFLATLSCGKDDENDAGIVNVENGPSEEIVLDATDISQKIEINGAIRIQGNTPSSNSEITFLIDSEKQIGFQQIGFTITLIQTPNNYAGAYFQIKNNKELASEYFNIPLEAGKRSKNGIKTPNVFTSKSSKPSEHKININFSNIPIGEICYLLSVYDSRGNISNPKEVCIDVKPWTEDAIYIGTWEFEKRSRNKEETFVDNAYCEKYTLDCINGDLIDIDYYCHTISSYSIVFNSDKSYEMYQNSEVRSIDNNLSRESCDSIFKESEKYKRIHKGEWSYFPEDKLLYFIETEYIENDVLIERNFGSNYYFTTVDSKELILKRSFEEHGDTIIIEDHFKK